MSISRSAASLVVCGTLALSSCIGSDGPDAATRASDPITRGCGLSPAYLKRIERGHHPVRSEDVTMVPDEPNFVGTFLVTSHSGPWDYIQGIPLALYGPGHISAAGEVSDKVTLADIFPTMGEVLGIRLPDNEGTVLPGALPETASQPPKLVMEIVWDGAGKETLDKWPDAWPNLRRLMDEGVSYDNAIVGSSPTITTAAHSTIATGWWPRAHGITGNDLRTASGSIEGAFGNYSPQQLKRPTLGDVFDRRLDNQPRVGLLGWVRWHVGFLSHGTQRRGGDKDQMALIHYDDGVEIKGNDRYFEVPQGLTSAADIDEELDALDREDGAVDDKWLGNDIRLNDYTWWTDSNPAWVRYQTAVALEMLRDYEYGRDSVPDLFLTNFKMTDLAGHRWGMDSPETEQVLKAQDEALGRILGYLRRKVQDFVVVLTADHGAAPLATSTGAWPIYQQELIRDVDRHFAVPEDESLIADTAVYGLYLDRANAERFGVTASDVSWFLNGYTIADNWAEEDLPEDYEDRGDEFVFSAVFPSGDIDDIVECAASK